MFVLSFFSAKGGTGKTTFNMSMASYLKYSLGGFDLTRHHHALADAEACAYIARELL